MDLVFFFSFVVVAMVVMVAVGSIQVLQVNQLNTTLRSLARRYRGSVVPGDLFQRPSLRFTYRDARVLVDYFSTGGKHKRHYTQVKLYGHIPRIRCEIYPEGLWSSLGRLIGFEDISIGNSRFDRDYVIRGGSRQAVHALLTPAVQDRINALRGLRGNGDIYVGLTHGMLHVRKRGRLRDFDSLNFLIDQSLRLYDLATDVSQDGIEFVSQAEVEEAWTEAICQVCGDVIRENVVVCSQCGTPHHQDCWEYYGACSTYGCRETRYRYPRRPLEASLVKPPPGWQ